jgi:hypothetical protein
VAHYESPSAEPTQPAGSVEGGGGASSTPTPVPTISQVPVAMPLNVPLSVPSMDLPLAPIGAGVNSGEFRSASLGNGTCVLYALASRISGPSLPWRHE